MKRLKLKVIFLAAPAVLLLLGVGAVCTASSEIGLLSDAQLAALAGGSSHYCWTEAGGQSDYSNCESHECEDIGCSPAETLIGGSWFDTYVKGNDGDTTMVEACYDTDTSSDCCSPGSYDDTECDGEYWFSQSDCKNDETSDGTTDVQKNDCTGC